MSTYSRHENERETAIVVPEGLKHCPICGDPVDILSLQHEGRPAAAAWTARIICKGCWLTLPSTGFSATEAEAIQKIAVRWNARFRSANDANRTLDANLTERQIAAFRHVVTSLLVDTRNRVLPTNIAEFVQEAVAEKERHTPNDKRSLINMAKFCIHGILLLQAESRKQQIQHN